MVYKLSIRKEAETDIAEAYQYYERCREGLGADFMLCTSESLSRIQRNPKQFRSVQDRIRRALVKKFLYGIFYTLTENEIIVLAVTHARRNPKHWQSRS
ncbi:MAG: type II toxin-antitoxin system RelE/ParE family toxin [Gammaproteobacteria bacterium]|nr:type II toxin-antitoxin system RelE/ParE family toxin [Gammaproteobacteria bacterium]